jgi:hypothetical protein
MSFFSSFGQSLFGVPQTSGAGAAAGSTAATNAATLYGGQLQSDRNSQLGVNAGLQQTINGTAPSPADIQLQQSLDEEQRRNMSMGAGGTGANAVLARYQAAQLNGGEAAATSAAGALQRAQETAAARQQLSANNQGLMSTGAGLYGDNLSNGLGYANLSANIANANAGRQQQAEAAGLGALSGTVSGLGSLGASYFSGMPPGIGAPSTAGTGADASGAAGNDYWNSI